MQKSREGAIQTLAPRDVAQITGLSYGSALALVKRYGTKVTSRYVISRTRLYRVLEGGGGTEYGLRGKET